MGKIRPVLLLGAAVVIALITTLLIYNSIQKRAGVAKAPILETQPIAVATVDLNWGTVVVREMVKMEPFLKTSLPAGAYTDMNSLVGRVVISSIRAKEPFLESRLAPQTLKTGGVAAIIGSKKRAVAVRVDKVIGVAGFIHPGHRVDVLVTMAKGKAEEPVTKIVLNNILVLAAGPEVQTAKGKEQQPATVDVITLEVTPDEAEKLALAASEGKLQLALRGLIDTEEVLTKGTSIPVLLASYSGGSPAAKTAVKTVKRTYPRSPVKAKSPAETQVAAAAKPLAETRVLAVELIQGGKVSILKFEEGN